MIGGPVSLRILRFVLPGLAFLLAVYPAAAGGGAEVDKVLDAVVGAYGGPTAVERLGAFRMTAEVSSLLQRAPGKVRRDYRSPDKLRVEIAYPAMTEVRILDGEKGWRGSGGRLERVNGAPRLAMVYQMLRSSLPEPLVRHRALVELLGTRKKDGVDHQVLRLPWSGELELVFWVDAETHRVAWVEGTMKAQGMQTQFATHYKDFQIVEGVLFAFGEENFASGQHTGDTKVLSIVFSPPDLGPFDPTRL